MRVRQRRAGLTLVEVLLVIGNLAVLAALFFGAAGPVKKRVQVASCTSHLRQLGMAFRMYHDDYEQYPLPPQLTQGSYLRSGAILFCPEDDKFAPLGAGTSYRFRADVPPRFEPINTVTNLDPNVVLLMCQHHLGQREIILKGDNTRTTPPTFPYLLTMRASGEVERVFTGQVKRFMQPRGKRNYLRSFYPREPGYDQASRS